MACVRSSLFGVGLLVLFAPAAAQAVDCFVDSVAGDDTKSGLTEADAVQSRAKVPASCTVVKFKRGSVFNVAKGEQVLPAMASYASKVKTLTNYGDPSLPSPKFVKVREPNNGSMISAYQGGVTIDGLYLEGSQSDTAMKNLAQGVCVMIGSGSTIINNEIANCDIGIMLSGTGSLVRNNFIHDLHVNVDSCDQVDPNVVGGAEGIFVNGSNNEVAYNSFVNCTDFACWTGGNCDGGATEVTVGKDGAELTGVNIHHNYSYNSCGFFEVSSMFSSDPANPVRGKFTNSSFTNNVAIDSGWLHLLQVANTDMHNIRWENNTVVQHKGSVNEGMLMVVYTATASGMSGGQLYEDSIYWTNNLFVADGVNFMSPDSRVIQTTNLIIKNAATQNPGFVNLKGTNAADYDLVQGSPAIDVGTVLANVTVDFLDRARPDSATGKADIGAFEYASVTVTPPPANGGSSGATGGAVGDGGSSGSTGKGGATSVPTGKGGATSVPTGKGGATTLSGNGGAGGTEPPGAGGTTAPVDGTGNGGCSCQLGPEGTALPTWLVVAAALALALRRRRR